MSTKATHNLNFSTKTGVKCILTLATLFLCMETATAQTLTIEGNVAVKQNQTVNGQVTANSMTVTQGTTTNSIAVTQSATANSLTVTNNGRVNGPFEVLGSTTLGPLTSGSQTVHGGIAADGAVNAGALSVTGNSFLSSTTASDMTITNEFTLPTTTVTPTNPCTPGQLLIGPGGSNSNGKGGWLYFCRLGGTWATANFQNL